MVRSVEQPAASEGAATHVDLILQQIGSLPTLSPIAVRVMGAANTGDADLREIAGLIESDPSLSAKVLALCRRADWALSKRVMTVDRAVVLLGLEAVRAAVLSVEIHDAFSHKIEKGKAEAPDTERFDRRELWRHSIAVASAAELIAESQPGSLGGYTAQEAFLAGLLHDLGKVALEALLPRSYGRVASIARDRGLSIAEVEKRVLGIDHHVAGKRLAEHWGLPHALQDVMWLHGQPSRLLPDVPHRTLIGAVTVADNMVRRLHLGWSGNGAPPGDAAMMCREFGLDGRRIGDVDSQLIERVSRRCAHLGLDDVTPSGLMLESISRANSLLGRFTEQAECRAREAKHACDSLAEVTSFLTAGAWQRGFASALAEVGRHAARMLSGPFLAVVTETRRGGAWTMHRFDRSGESVPPLTLTPPEQSASLSLLASEGAAGSRSAGVLTWLTERAKEVGAAGELDALPLSGGEGGFIAILLHERSDTSPGRSDPSIRALAAAWGAALAAAARHDGARRMGEQLAEANQRLSEAQSKLVDQRSMERLREIAAGAAHEMNNPLTVISGNAQNLARGTKDAQQQASAAAIVRAAETLSNMITSLHLFADPPSPSRSRSDIAELLHKSSRLAKQRFSASGNRRSGSETVNVSCQPGLPPASIDARQITLALSELILNALQASPKRGVDVRAAADPYDGRLVITVSDDGAGMSSHALEHAFDPFFSEHQAGRRPGLGLTRARRFVDLHGGDLVLESQPGKGTTARIFLPDWRDGAESPIGVKAA